MNKPFITTARDLAIEAHQSVNQKYDGYLPYEFHLRMVVRACDTFVDCVAEGDVSIRQICRSACWMHDVLEDTHLSYNDLVKALVPHGHPEAWISDAAIEIVYAVTNNKGRNRKERANDAYYNGIRATPHAVFVKLCDRIANVTYGRLTGGDMVNVYRREHTNFKDRLYDTARPEYQPLWDHLNKLLNSTFTLDR